MQKQDAKGFGALEHHTSTSVCFPEAMPEEALGEQIKDVVSHEFFHTVTPLSIHAKEIQYFDYNDPKMSKHLWMYEGVTEYFANLFQVNQGLIDADEFYLRMVGKIKNASELNDTMPFTEMSANVLAEPYKSQYLNVYEKGALIGMCLDIIIREKSNGERGILDLMKKLSKEYGPSQPFNDEELFAKITALTYPEVGEFLNTYVAGKTPIPYETYFAKMGVTKTKIQVPGNPFLKDASTPFITINPKTKEIMVIPGSDLNDFMNNLGIKGGDTILSINDKPYNLDNIYDMIMESQNWKADDAISVKIRRDGNEQTINGKVKLSFMEEEGYKLTDTTKEKLNQAQTEMEVAKLKLENDLSLLDRQKKLWSGEIGSKNELEQRELAYKNSMALYNASKLKWNDLKKQIDFQSKQTEKSAAISSTSMNDYIVKSEIAGRIYSLSKEKGEMINTQTPIAIIGDANKFYIELQVDEYDISKLVKGQKIIISMDSYKGQTFEAELEKIYPLMNEKSKSFKVDAVFINQPQNLFPNLSAQANIILEVKEKVLTIPRSFLIDNEYVYLANKEKRKVKIGLMDYEKVEIVSGLTIKDALVNSIQ
jgi:biotin carboxyl carrier protein